MSGTLIIGLILFGIYYQKESLKIKSEQKIALKLYDMQCKRLLKNAPSDFNCSITKPDFSDKRGTLLQEIVIGILIVLILSTLLSLYLAHISLYPMKEAIRVMDNFVNSIIHDLNTPISSARLNANALLRENLDSNKDRRVRRILESLKMLQEFEIRLKDAIKSANIEYKDEKFSLCELCKKLKDKSPLIKLECKNDIKIIADKIMIERVIDNLISNSIKYNQNNNPIIITIKDTKLTIKDQGIGIKNSDKIFEPYYREKTQITGLGIGLGVVKSVCEYYKIDIKIDSKIRAGTKIILDFKSLCTNQYLI